MIATGDGMLWHGMAYWSTQRRTFDWRPMHDDISVHFDACLDPSGHAAPKRLVLRNHFCLQFDAGATQDGAT